MDQNQILAEIQMSAAATPVKTHVKSEIVDETVEVLVADGGFMEAAVNSFQFELLEGEKEEENVVQFKAPAPGVQNAQTVLVDLRKPIAPTPERVSVISSARTPVIVTRPTNAQPSQAPNAVTANIFSGASQATAKPAPKAVTESVFSVQKVSTGLSEEDSEPSEADIFAELFLSLDQIDNLDKLAPHAGNKCIPLSRNEENKTPEMSTLSFDDLFESNDRSPGFDQLSSSPGSVGDSESRQDVFINPSRNLMWGNSEGPGEGNKKLRIQNPRSWMEHEPGAWPDFLCDLAPRQEARMMDGGGEQEVIWTGDLERSFRSGEGQEIFHVPKISPI